MIAPTSTAGFTIPALIGGLAVLLLGGAWFVTTQSDTPTADPVPRETEPTTDSSTATTPNDTVTNTTTSSDNGETTTETINVSRETNSPGSTRNAGTFEEYSPEKLARAETGTVVLFFHAEWCPSCRALEDDIEENRADIPPNTHILKVDYDTATELKRRYNVVRQHTLVEVNAAGEAIQTLTGLTNTLDQVVEKL